MREEKISEEFAEVELNRFIEEMDIEADESKFDDEDAKSFSEIKQTIIKNIMKGALIINDNGEPTFTPQRSDDKKPITFYEPDGATIQAMDKRKKGEEIAKTFALMGAMTKTNAKTFANMKTRDLKVCQAIVGLLMG